MSLGRGVILPFVVVRVCSFLQNQKKAKEKNGYNMYFYATYHSVVVMALLLFRVRVL